MSAHRKTLLFSLLASIVMVAGSSAQSTLVWPSGYDVRPGNAAQVTPFSVSSAGTPRGSRSATLFRASSLPFGPGSTLTAISYRRDAGSAQAWPRAAGRFDAHIGPVDDAMRPNAAFRDLFSERPVRIAFGNLVLPDAPPPGAGPAPFSVTLPFQRPWTYAGGDFAFDVVFTGPAGSDWHRDAVWVQPQRDGLVRTIGTGCPTTDGFLPQPWITAEDFVVGGQMVVQVQGGPNAAVLLPELFVGLPRAVPLPLGGLGFAPTCRLHIDPVLSVPAQSTSPTRVFSVAEYRLGVPLTSVAVGAQLGLQWAVPDPGAVSLFPFVMSNAILAEIGAPAPADPEWGRTFWGRDVNFVGIDYSGRIGPPNWVPITQFHGTFR